VIVDREGRQCDAVLNDALFIPAYPQNIFSVQAATEKGVTVTFNPDSAELVTPNGSRFNIVKSGRLYY
jgi:hypothetical protein